MRTNHPILSIQTLVLFGCGGHARSVADVYLTRFPDNRLLFVDEQAKPSEQIFNFPVVSICPSESIDCFVAVGDNQKRKQLWEHYSSNKKMVSILAPSALISSYAHVGENVFVGQLAHIGPDALVGCNTIVNTGAIVEHETTIGAHCHVGPNAVISGRCTIGNQVFVGVGAVIKDSIQIGSNIVIGAGAVVVHDLLEPGVYVGCPAKPLKQPL